MESMLTAQGSGGDLKSLATYQQSDRFYFLKGVQKNVYK